ncbi:putative FAD-binding Berberine family protein [Hibiscus syriacus]|uniref:FAD-binding Berberine family protein n=1 Tax=Hibiscus syriacus TaxID=106335 RepID=A0A6A3CAZ5_HIBSY|nr:mitogen-activated protein kinase kinase 7-like [Hibiscus syriacus]KAE8724698.1 putative FAD-binding Berberine family protein [Hibiscus syriacus]
MDVKVVKIKVLGKGCFGVVHLVKTITLVYNQVYAMKSADEDHTPSLRMEEEIIQQFVDSPNIIQCYGGFTSIERERGMVYNILLEYASGGNLEDLINKYGGDIPERDVACYTRMILEGLSSIHRKGYVHSDLKPANILVFPPHGGTGLPNLKIGDFGIAKEERVKEMGFGFRGSIPYMSPESILGDVSGALDVWSLGCVVVQMMTGNRLPWENYDANDLMNKLLRGETPNIPENMSILGKDFLAKCFDVNPNRRWSASMLLRHPYVIPQHVLPRGLQLSYNSSHSSTYPQQVCQYGIPQGFIVYDRVLLEKVKCLEELQSRKMISYRQPQEQKKGTEYLCNCCKGFRSRNH